MSRCAFVALSLVLGCGDDALNPFNMETTADTTSASAASSSGMPTTGEATGTDTSISTESSSGSTALDSAETGTKLDVGFETDTETDTIGGMGCEKIDFLFIIDNSGSMRDEQDELIAAFPGFIEAIRNEVQGTDHHIMVVDSDANPAYLCEEWLDGAHCAGTNIQPDCSGYVCGSVDTLGPCDTTRGAGVVHPVGGSASNMDCGFPAGRRYLTSDDDDLDGKFACAAKVGTSGDILEYPLTAATEAVSDPLGGNGECNEGFLRDDAILVVTVVSDDPSQPGLSDGDDATSGDPQAWYDALVAAKNDNADAIAVIGIIPYGDTSCLFPMEETPNFVDFVELFGDKGFPASICEDFVEIFADTIAIIDTTCDEFEPEG